MKTEKEGIENITLWNKYCGRKMMKVLLAVALFLGFLQTAYAANKVMLVALDKNSAILIIDGNEVTLKEGQSIYDVKLIEATHYDTLLEVNGLRQRLRISSQIQVGASYQRSTKKKVRIASQQDGHHWVAGQINGRSVNFIVDTGATIIAMNQSTAKRLRINYKQGKTEFSHTANGKIKTKIVMLNRVSVGGITQDDVLASILPDESLSVVLLGNSFLNRVNMKIDNGVMILEQR
jgi:aspartyl protease family protein